MSSRAYVLITTLLLSVGLLIANCFSLSNEIQKQEAVIKKLTNKPTVIYSTNEYETAELRSQVAYYKTSYENIKYDYDKLTAALGNWTEVIQGWLEQVNANYRR